MMEDERAIFLIQVLVEPESRRGTSQDRERSRPSPSTIRGKRWVRSLPGRL
jgi:hypothetical protein